MCAERKELNPVTPDASSAVGAEFARAGAVVPGGDITSDADALLRLHACWIVNNWAEWTQGVGADGSKTKTKLPAKDLSRIVIDNIGARIKLKGEGDAASFGERLDKLLASIKSDDEQGDDIELDGPEYDDDSPLEIPDSDVVFSTDSDDGPSVWPLERGGAS